MTGGFPVQMRLPSTGRKVALSGSVAGGAMSAITTALVCLAACTRVDPPEVDGKLVVAIRETPAFFQREGSTTSGFEHDLVTAFADSLGFKTQFINAADPYELNDMALGERVHLAASMPLGNSQLQYSTPIRTVTQWIVGHNDVLGPEQLSDLAGRSVEVMAGSPLADTLRGLDEKSRPQVVEVPGANEMGLLARVAEHKAELAAVHEIHLDLGVNFYPELRPLLQLPGMLEFGWAFGGDGAAALRAKADAFIAEARANGTLARIHDRYFGHIKRINANGITQFLDDMKIKLPNWRRDFQSAQDLSGIDWRLLAALAYQESHWDPLATSPTGVRGMMMLTEDTADHLRVKNRLDAQESIPLDTTLYLDLLGVGTIVTLEGQEMIHARAIEAIIRQAEYDIQTLATRIDMGRALLLHPIGRDGVVEVET